MSNNEDVIQGHDGYIAVERQSGSGTMFSDSAGLDTMREQPVISRPTTQEKAVAEISQRIADAVVDNLAAAATEGRNLPGQV